MILLNLDELPTTIWVSVYTGITVVYFGKRVAQDVKTKATSGGVPLKPLRLPRHIVRLFLLIAALTLYIISLIWTLPSRDSLLGVVITMFAFFGIEIVL